MRLVKAVKRVTRELSPNKRVHSMAKGSKSRVNAAKMVKFYRAKQKSNVRTAVKNRMKLGG